MDSEIVSYMAFSSLVRAMFAFPVRVQGLSLGALALGAPVREFKVAVNDAGSESMFSGGRSIL